MSIVGRHHPLKLVCVAESRTTILVSTSVSYLLTAFNVANVHVAVGIATKL